MCLGRPTEATGRGETWLGRQTEATGGGETGKTGGKEGKTGGEKGTGGVAAGSSAGSAKCCGGRSPGSGISGTHWAAGSLQAISGLRWQEAFLVVAAAVGVDEGYETVELGVVRGEGEQALQQSLETLNLVLVAFGGAFLQKFLYPVGDEEFRSAAGVGSSVDRYPEFREEDADSGEVEVAEMQIAVRYALQPSHQVTRLWIAADK